jgi:hypothetical protein
MAAPALDAKAAIAFFASSSRREGAERHAKRAASSTVPSTAAAATAFAVSPPRRRRAAVASPRGATASRRRGHGHAWPPGVLASPPGTRGDRGRRDGGSGDGNRDARLLERDREDTPSRSAATSNKRPWRRIRGRRLEILASDDTAAVCPPNDVADLQPRLRGEPATTTPGSRRVEERPFLDRQRKRGR